MNGAAKQWSDGSVMIEVIQNPVEAHCGHILPVIDQQEGRIGIGLIVGREEKINLHIPVQEAGPDRGFFCSYQRSFIGGHGAKNKQLEAEQDGFQPFPGLISFVNMGLKKYI